MTIYNKMSTYVFNQDTLAEWLRRHPANHGTICTKISKVLDSSAQVRILQVSIFFSDLFFELLYKWRLHAGFFDIFCA